MLQISVNVDPSKALGYMDDLQERQFPFAVATALNCTANDAQGAERYRITANFKLRRKAFILRQVYISKQDRANKSTWRVWIQLQEQFKDMAGFEEGDDRTPHGGSKWLWKPNPDVFKSQVIGSANPLAPKNLRFQKDPGGRIVGNQRTFMVRTKARGQLLVLQRVDRTLTSRSKRAMGRLTLDNLAGAQGPNVKKAIRLQRTAGVRMLYQLVSRSHVPAKLEFVGTITRTAQDVFPARMREAMDQAVRSSR